MPLAFYIFIVSLLVLILQGALYMYEASHGRVRTLATLRRKGSFYTYRLLESSYEAVVSLQEKLREKTPVHRRDVYAFLQKLVNSFLSWLRAFLSNTLRVFSRLHRVVTSVEKRRNGDRQSTE